jgi:hypothetical protein
MKPSQPLLSCDSLATLELEPRTWWIDMC